MAGKGGKRPGSGRPRKIRLAPLRVVASYPGPALSTLPALPALPSIVNDARAQRYGLTVAQLRDLETQHAGRCALCRETARLYVDHSHATGDVRGLLCCRCNSGLGLFRDNADTLTAAAKYVTRPEQPYESIRSHTNDLSGEG